MKHCKRIGATRSGHEQARTWMKAARAYAVPYKQVFGKNILLME